MENFNLLAFYDLRRGTDMEYSIDTWNLERNRGKYTRTAGRTDERTLKSVAVIILIWGIAGAANGFIHWVFIYLRQLSASSSSQ